MSLSSDQQLGLKTNNLLGVIPLAGPLSRLYLKTYMVWFREDMASMHSLHVDLANLINPIKWVSEPVRHVCGALRDYNEGIWIGNLD